MNTNPVYEPAIKASIQTRLDRLERSTTRWKTLAVAGIAAGIGLIAGGMNRQPSRVPTFDNYRYVATDDTIYRIDRTGVFEYIKFENGQRTPEGYFNWGQTKVDNRYTYPTRPQP